MKNRKLTIVIPCYNEVLNLKKIIDKINFEVDQNNINFIIVNNGSIDDTKKILDQIKINTNFIKVHHIVRNIGYGNGILEGLKIANTEFIGWTHADNPKNIDDVIKAYKILNKNNENIFIKGFRTSNRPIIDIFFSYSFNLLSSIFLKKILWEITAQPTIFNKKFFANFKNAPIDFSLDLYSLYMAKKNKLKILRMKTEYKVRLKGKSKWNTGLKSKIILSIKYIKYIIKLKKYN